ncbi:MAG: 4-(cytidine 5'-diphospho)-2-C-methyl-D-erythritol kinase, partial [Candidatus Omnitrophica bacterium]|nr:4-(cytidine 5'-diphospho)-2-C-methyl-D-erythritol kinase [Candidatus Omnitrophota bacterium]
MREIRVFAPCKLNLYLDVLGKRPDGFHDIETIFEKIDLKDEIILKEKGKGLKVRATPSNCGQGKDNIVYKAAKTLFKEIGISLNLDIEIKKRIPVSAGLGGGSSDAASVLRAINEIFKL